MKNKQTILVIKNKEIRRWGCVNAEGEEVIPFEYNWINEKIIVKKFLIAVKDGYYGVIDVDEKIILPFEYDYISPYPKDEKKLLLKKDDKKVLFDVDEKLTLPYEDEKTNEDEETDEDEETELDLIDEIEKFGIIDQNGNTVHPFEYDEARDLFDFIGEEDLLLQIKKNGKYGALNYDRKLVLPLEYDEFVEDFLPFGFKILRVKKNGKYGVWSTSGMVIPLEYDDLRHVDFASVKAFFVKKNEKWGVLNFDNEIVLPCIYDDIYWDYAPDGVYGVYYYALKEGKWGLYNRKGEMLMPHEYDYLHSEDWHPKFWIVKQNNKFGIFNIKREIVVPLAYDKITVFSSRRSHTRFFEIEKNGEPSLIFNRKKIIASESYKHKKIVHFSTEKKTE